MRIHHLNCTTMCPPGKRLMVGRSNAWGPALLVCHCLLLETPRGLVLVDTGFGLQDVWHAHPRIAPFFLANNRPVLLE
ncbi:MAG: MBL fold metallo-hydrolase, partial [Myxococcales bacterium]